MYITPRSGAVLIAVLMALVGCDSGDDDVRPVDVAGEYVFTEFVFVPDSPLLPSANLLDTLVTDNTRLQLFSSGRFTLLYQFEGASAEFVGGDFDVNERRVRLRGHEDEARFYRALLLGTEITLEREPQRGFTAGLRRTVNLEEFSQRYAGIRSVDGVVHLALSPR